MKQQIPARTFMIILFWLAVWQLAASAIQNNIVFVGPADVVRSFAMLLPDLNFWRAVSTSSIKIISGFLSALVCGTLFGSMAFCIPALRHLLAPLITLAKSVPVASFVILILIWIGSENLSVFISFLMVFPIIYVNTIAGLESTDKKLMEMAQVFSLNLPRRILYIYLPAMMPYLINGCKLALGMSWKSGVAAEVIGVPSHTIGEQLYLAKVYLSTGDLFAWTIVIILVSAAFEKLFLWLLCRFSSLSTKRRFV